MSNFNWTNYDRLVTHLKGMEPRLFNYANNVPCDDEAPCCVACQIRALETGSVAVAGGSCIERFLGCTATEAYFLFGYANRNLSPDDMDAWAAVYNDGIGEFGIREALRRLAVVAARYVRPEEEKPVEPPVFVGDDVAFLASVRALVGQPLIAEPVE